jgi:glycosyltransferase involved in cell wall biosynthesis
MKQLSICIPAYNEEKAIGNTLRELVNSFPEAEIIVVDDCSNDKTGEISRSIHGIKVLSHKRNKGYGASLKTAMRNITGEVVAWYDADGQHRAEDLKKVVQPVLDGKKDVVIGIRDKDSDKNIDRIPGKLILKLISEIIVRERVPDLNSGLRCFKWEIIKKYLHLLPDGFSASSTSTILMMKRGHNIGYQKIVTRKREGKSNVKIIKDGWNTIKLLINLIVLFEAFGFFTILSLLQIIPGIIYGFCIAFLVKRGFPTLASTVIISGIITFFMGIVTDQITSLRKEKLED